MADVILAKMESEEENHPLTPPFGILYLAHSLEQAGFSVQVFHETGTEANIKHLTELVSTKKPLFVGLSTLTGRTILPTIQASKAIKESESVPVVWGGLHPTMLPQQTLMNDFIDLVVIGEGEMTVVELAEALREHGPSDGKLAQVAGIAFKSDGKMIRTQPRPFIKDLDNLYPAWHHMDFDRYFHPGNHFYDDHGFQISGEKIAPIFSSRGCPWRCGFCYNQIVNKRVFRAHSAQRVISDVKTYKEKYGITGIVFYDDYFFAAKNRALEIIRNIGIPWSSNLRADHMDKWGDEFAKEVSQHNCKELRIAIESGSQRVLDIMKKDITVDEHRRSVELCVKYNIPVTVAFMIGLPGETWSDTLETLAYVDKLEGMGDNVRTLGPGIYMPYPGTPLFDAAVEDYGFEPPTSLQEWNDCVFGHKQPLTPYVDKRIKFIAHYKGLNFRTDIDRLPFSLPTKMIRQAARWRWRNRFFRFPFDYTLPVFGLNMLTELGLADMYGKLRKSMWKP